MSPRKHYLQHTM